MKLRASDTVVVITGKDKGKTGKILRVLADRCRVVVEGVNMRTRHIKKTPQKAGQIVRYEASIHISNVMLRDPKTGKRTRMGYQFKDGQKLRIAKKSGSVVTASPMPKISKGKKKKSEKEDDVPVTSTIPPKKSFWKKLGFGADALEEAEMGESAHKDGTHPGRSRSTKEDHSVPSDSRLQSTRSHGRGS